MDSTISTIFAKINAVGRNGPTNHYAFVVETIRDDSGSDTMIAYNSICSLIVICKNGTYKYKAVKRFSDLLPVNYDEMELCNEEMINTQLISLLCQLGRKL